MKIYLNIEAESPQEMSAVLQGLAGIGVAAVNGPGELQVASVVAAADPAAADEPKKTRGRPKADVKTPAAEPEPAAPSEPAAREPVETKPDVKPITFDEVKASIIDLLNDWTEAMPKEVGPETTTVVDGRTIKVAEIRTTILADMLPKLGASGKISTIPEESFGKVQALIDESREKLAEYAAQREVEE
jgi:hypothetical protein